MSERSGLEMQVGKHQHIDCCTIMEIDDVIKEAELGFFIWGCNRLLWGTVERNTQKYQIKGVPLVVQPVKW